MCDIDDPLGQPHSPASNDHYSHLKVVLFCEILKDGNGRTDEQPPRAKIVIITGRDCGSASWINIVVCGKSMVLCQKNIQCPLLLLLIGGRSQRGSC